MRWTALVAAGMVAAFASAAWAQSENDYPTDVRADYVFGCMAANGQSREQLEHCSCSIDVIASILPYERYVQASTILSMRQGIGNRANAFRSAKLYDDIVADLRRTQAEAEIRCFR
jgi:hypothetical protein